MDSYSYSIKRKSREKKKDKELNRQTYNQMQIRSVSMKIGAILLDSWHLTYYLGLINDLMIFIMLLYKLISVYVKY